MLNQSFINNVRKNQVLKLFLWALQAKHQFPYTCNCSGYPTNVKDAE